MSCASFYSFERSHRLAEELSLTWRFYNLSLFHVEWHFCFPKIISPIFFFRINEDVCDIHYIPMFKMFKIISRYPLFRIRLYPLYPYHIHYIPMFHVAKNFYFSTDIFAPCFCWAYLLRTYYMMVFPHVPATLWRILFWSLRRADSTVLTSIIEMRKPIGPPPSGLVSVDPPEATVHFRPQGHLRSGCTSGLKCMSHLHAHPPPLPPTSVSAREGDMALNCEHFISGGPAYVQGRLSYSQLSDSITIKANLLRTMDME